MNRFMYAGNLRTPGTRFYYDGREYILHDVYYGDIPTEIGNPDPRRVILVDVDDPNQDPIEMDIPGHNLVEVID